MSKLEYTEPKPRFEIAKDDVLPNEGLVSMPLTLRKKAIEDFDRENKFAMLQESEKKQSFFDEQNDHLGLAEFLANASLLFREKEYDLAQEFYSSVLKLDSNNELALKGLAECASILGNHEDAVRILERLTVMSRSAHHSKMLGDELYLLEYFEDAIQAYSQALNLNVLEGNDLFEIYKNFGNSLLRLGDDKTAEEYYSKAYALNPDSDTLMVNFASLSLYRGDLESALERFRQSVKINDTNDRAWVGLAMIHREYGDAELSWANVEKALDINPSNSSAIKLVCEWAMKDNEIQRGLIRTERFVERSPDDAQMVMWFAKFLYFDGSYEAALVQIERALRLNSELEGAREVLKVIREEMRDREIKLK